jgi:Spy/CpxP family protein refolding chaperone
VSEPVRPLRRARALSAALLGAVFAAGALVGVAADRALAPHGGRSHRHGHGLEAEIFEHLKLDAGQKAAVEKILERRRKEAATVWSEVKPQLNRVVDGTRDDLSRVLTPSQLREYDRLMAERRRRFESRFESGSNKGGS